MPQTTLKMSSVVSDESNLFQQHTKKWLEEVIETSLRKTGPKGNLLASSSRNSESNSVKLDAEVGPKVTVIEFVTEIFPENEKRPFPRQLPILKIMVKYQVAPYNTISTDHLIVKMLDDETFDGNGLEDNFGKRELNFYLNAISDMQAWTETRGWKKKLSVPKCFYGKFHAQKAESSRLPPPFETKEETLLLSNRSTLVLEDLTHSGFSHAYTKNELRREQLRHSLKEIAAIHAVSWAYQNVTGEDLGKKYNLSEDTDEFVEGFVEDIEESFPFLVDYLNTNVVPEGLDLLRRLTDLKSRAKTVLQGLLTPPDPSRGPSCLIHMDFWDQNLMFKDTCGGLAIECRILDWQNIVIGSPTIDIACILFTSVSYIHRSFNTTNLLEFYWDAFKDAAGNLKVPVPYTFDCLKEEYKKSKLFPLLVMLGSIGMILDKPQSTAKFIQIAKELAEVNLI